MQNQKKEKLSKIYRPETYPKSFDFKALDPPPPKKKAFFWGGGLYHPIFFSILEIRP